MLREPAAEPSADCRLSLGADLELHAVSDVAVRDVDHLAHRIPAAAGGGDAAHRRRLVPAGAFHRRDRVEPDAPVALLGGRARARPPARDDAAGHADHHVHPVHHPPLGARCAFLIRYPSLPRPGPASVLSSRCRFRWRWRRANTCGVIAGR